MDQGGVQTMKKTTKAVPKLPGHDCGTCGFRTCNDFAEYLVKNPSDLKRCIHLTNETTAASSNEGTVSCASCGKGATGQSTGWKDSLGREFDFILDLLPGDPGPRETILPHNPMLTRELDIKVGDKLFGRPLGMSCGCPITHCGVVVAVDHKTGVMTWCVTGPLGPRREKYIDIGYYSAEAYDGIVKESQSELQIGKRYFFLPHRCMLQWRHSGLVNFLNKGKNGLVVRVEGLWIG
jgi:uncharacterized Fe-S cluster-containing protein